VQEHRHTGARRGARGKVKGQGCPADQPGRGEIPDKGE
jgi:hypothetical protein